MQKWIEISEKFSHVTDKLGKHMDKGILDTVVALNVLGFDTDQSCEGHLDHGLPYPWVDIRHTAEEHYELFRNLSRFYDGRVVSFDRIITMNERGRISSQGGKYFSLLPEDERVARLNEYQDEMREFTAFLKSICLGAEKDV